MYTGCYTNIHLQPVTLSINMKCFYWVIISKLFLYIVCMTSFPFNKSFILTSCVIRVLRKQHNQWLTKTPIPCTNDNLYWKLLRWYYFLLVIFFSDFIFLYVYNTFLYPMCSHTVNICIEDSPYCVKCFTTHMRHMRDYGIHLQMIWYRIMNESLFKIYKLPFD